MSEKPSLKIVQTEPRSILELLWRQFPQLRNATVVWRVSYGGTYDGVYEGGLDRTFRTIDGQYLRIVSTKRGNAIEAVPADL